MNEIQQNLILILLGNLSPIKPIFTELGTAQPPLVFLFNQFFHAFSVLFRLNNIVTKLQDYPSDKNMNTNEEALPPTLLILCEKMLQQGGAELCQAQ